MVRSSAMQALCLFGLLAASMVEAFAPMTALPRANLALRRSAARPTMALSAVPLSSVGAAKAGLALQTSAATAQILMADFLDDVDPSTLIYGGLAVTVVAIGVMLAVLYQAPSCG
ncbi:hypothetical protein T484DRAFT_1795660 [Baffinella frigidus]|nr:hypothetical protein T484DRAFT_1795660 [Cryptophyta sp. CCMP2293]